MLTTACIADAGELTSGSAGKDWLEATTAERRQWLSHVVAAARMDAKQVAYIAACIEEALKARHQNETVVVEGFKSTNLAELSSLCALMAGR
jgi:hypothetical protein